MLLKNNKPALDKLFAADPERVTSFVTRHPRFLFDYSRVPVDGAGRERLFALADERQLRRRVAALFGGEIVNRSEHRPALHMALRAPEADMPLPPDQARRVAGTRRAFLALAERLYRGEPPADTSGRITDLIHIGIGGSDLGPRLVADALDRGDSAVNVHWMSTLDGRRWQSLAARLDPQTTAAVVVSKSFGTQETLLAAHAVREWLGPSWASRTWAVTARAERAREFGLGADHVFGIDEWVGGRFSLWSAVGLSAAAVIGTRAFERLLDGAWAADQRFRDNSWQDNPAVVLALIWHFLRTGCGYPAFGVISYEPRLALLPAWLQQVVMESLGKRVTQGGGEAAPASAPLIFGGVGTDLQHSLFQALHQGLDTHPVMLLGSVRAGDDPGRWQEVQLSHLFAQATALARGRQDPDPERELPGNRPSLTLLLDELDPESLAEILVMFEHAVFALGELWGINPFDQWGVEEGKRLAAEYLQQLREGRVDSAESPVSAFLRRHRR